MNDHPDNSRDGLGWMRAATLPEGDALLLLGADAVTGLTAPEAAARLKAVGGNEIPPPELSARDVLARQFTSPFVWLLLAAAMVAFIAGEPVDAALIALFTALNAALGFTQEFRAERAVRHLMKYWEGRTHVLRGGRMAVVPARELVPGDIVRLQAGDRVPADVRFLTARDLAVDESILTGESVPASKSLAALAATPQDYYAATCIGFFGTTLVSGETDALVIATGRRAALGGIAELTAAGRGESAFEREMGRFSGFVLRLVTLTLVAMFVLNIGIKGLDRVGELLLFSIALTVGVIPEALPAVSTIALAGGAARMARKQVVVKRLSAINDLGSIDVLCTDKTGTLTRNLLDAHSIRATDEKECLRLALLGSSFLGERERGQNNAFDLALWRRADRALRADTSRATKVAEIPFDPIRRMNAVLVRDGGRGLAILRGAPEEVLSRCGRQPDELAIGAWMAEHGLSGDRVIAVAAKPAENAEALKDGHGYAFAGLIAFRDPIKQSAYQAVRRAERLGVDIRILTGDSRDVSASVAMRLGLIHGPEETVTGAEFQALDTAGKHAALDRYKVFARMAPAQKFEVLELLKERRTVGFLGEGFNDAPGLKAAHVGIAVEGAADIARDAADVILLGRSLDVIMDGIEEGRRTFANTVKYLKITLASNFGNFYAVAVASFFIPFLPMLPLQILLLNLLTDVPMIALAGDNVDRDDLRKPSHHDARRLMLAATVLGAVSSAFDFGTFAIFRAAGEGYLQSVWFTVSALTEIALIYSLRSSAPFWKAPRPSFSLMGLTAAAAALAVALPFTALGQGLFRFVAPQPRHLLAAAALVIAYFVATETVKRWLYRAGGLLNGNEKTGITAGLHAPLASPHGGAATIPSRHR